ncbi:MAG TPA: hypothetical protein VGM84_19985 [Steroidobacteraceae bacterium]|jgi:hypothetical protein
MSKTPRIPAEKLRAIKAAVSDLLPAHAEATVADAQQRLLASVGIDSRHKCAACGGRAVVERSAYSKGHARTLEWAARESRQFGIRFVTPGKYGPPSVLKMRGVFTHNAWWGLIERRPESVIDETGDWGLTATGWRFIGGEIGIPSHVFRYGGHVLAHDDRKRVFITDVLPGFSLQKLLDDGEFAVGEQDRGAQ